MNVHIDQIFEKEAERIYNDLLAQCKNIDWIEHAFLKAWDDFVNAEFSYDGATFVREHEDNFWEVAAFIHDWLNSMGYVGKGIDLYFLEIMRQLDYSTRLIFERSKWMQWTWLNVFNHKYIKRDFVSCEIPEYLKI